MSKLSRRAVPYRIIRTNIDKSVIKEKKLVRAHTIALLLAVLCGVASPLRATTVKPVIHAEPENDSYYHDHLLDAAANGTKELFVYKPQNPKPNSANHTSTPATIETESSTAPSDEKENLITPNFENADLENFISFVAQLTKINVIPTKDTQGVKVSLNMRSGLTKKEVWEVFLTVTEMAGFTINKSGNVYKVIRQDAKKTEPLPAYINVPANTLPNSDQSIRFVTFLRNIQASDVESLLRGMLGSGGDLLRQDNVNGFIITDKCYNIKSAMTILNELDDAGLQEVFSVLPLKRADATEVKKLLDEMTKNAGDKANNAIVARLLGKTQESSEYFSAATRIIVEDRSNSLILLGNQKSIKRIEDFVAKYIEHEDPSPASPIHRYQLQYTDAQDIKTLLDSIVNTPTESGAERTGGVRNGGKYFKPMRFEVDRDSNTLLVSSLDPNDWKLLKKTIKDLDKPQPQCTIETLIVDIQLRDVKEVGAQLRMPRADQPFPNIGWQSAALAPIVTAGTTGNKSLLGDLGSLLSGLTQGTAAFALSRAVGGVWGVFQIVNQNFNTSLVDNSFITVANRTAGSFSVGETRRVVSQQYSGYSGATPSYSDKQAATSFNYTPQINSDGLINLNVKISMNDFGANDGVATKDFSSTLACADGQVLVLGGFVKTSATEAQSNGMPILSELPVVGWLFKDKNRSVTKTYTFFFICPTILRPREKPGIDMYTKMKLHRARRDVEASILTGNTKDPIHNMFFNGTGENYHHKVDDFANARFQPSTVDIRHDPFYNPGIDDTKRLDFQDDYTGDTVVQKLVATAASEQPDNLKNTPSQPHITHAPKPQSKKESEEDTVQPLPAQEPTTSPAPTDSIIKKLSKARKQPKRPPQAYAIELPKLPPISHEKREKLKEALEAAPTHPRVSQPSLALRRSALKELLNPTSPPVLEDRHETSISKPAVKPQIEAEPSLASPIAALTRTTPDIDALVAEQEEKRSKFKNMLAVNDTELAQEEAPLAARRRTLKELLASYPSGSSSRSPFDTQTPVYRG